MNAATHTGTPDAHDRGQASVNTTQTGTPNAHDQNTDPEVNQWVCLVMLTICIGIMAATAEWVSDLLTYA